MEFSGYEIPESLSYTKDHEWAMARGPIVLVGITDYAAKTLNDVVYVTLPKVGDRVSQSESFGTVESIKAVSELYSPLSGQVTSVNGELSNHPELVNKSPYEEGWLVQVRADDFSSESKRLLDARGYANLLSSLLKK